MEGDAARDGVCLGGVDPIHHMRVADPGAPARPSNVAQTPAVSTTPGAETYVDIEPALGCPVYLHTFAVGQFPPVRMSNPDACRPVWVEIWKRVVAMTALTAGAGAPAGELRWVPELSPARPRDMRHIVIHGDSAGSPSILPL